MERIISATIVSGAEAIHPGFGLLSEKTVALQKLCEECNIIFIGPDSNVIAKLGDKQAARETMISAGVPVIPGGDHAINDEKEKRDCKKGWLSSYD